MLKEHASTVRRLMILGDAVLVGVAFILAYVWVNTFRALFPFGVYQWLLPPVIVGWLIILHYYGAYESFRTRTMPETAGVILKAAAAGFLVFGSFAFLFKAVDFSRLFIVSTFGMAALALILERIVLAAVSRHVRRRGYNTRSLLIVGTGPRARRFLEQVERHAEWGLQIVGLVDDDPDAADGAIGNHPVLGTLQDLPDIIHRTVVDEVVFVVPRGWLTVIEPALRFCEMEGLRASIAVDFFDLRIARGKQTDLAGVPLLTFGTTPDQLWALIAKRAMDLALSAAGLLLLSPLFLAIAAAIKWTSPGPMLFRQQRCGLNGRRFTLYKFRTMVCDAEAQLPRLLARNEMEGPVFKLSRDPRVTRIGRFLRKTSFDELPQLWNVLVGEMSLVGPRPPLPVEVQRYDSWQRRKLSMRPGVTCLWQVNGRNNIRSFNDWVKMDLHYIDHWSLGLDWKILFKTVPAVVLGIGAR